MPLYCECCGRKLNEAKVVWLEKSFKTNRWFPGDECPKDKSQGNFAFGKGCAAKTLRKQAAA
jgi:hypothetical protein